jgi:DNA-binding SARP family transcriptional activator
MRLELLGPFRLSGGRGGAGQLPKKVQGLLAYLGMHGGQPIPREQLAALMWSDNGEDQARHSLRQSLVSLRAPLAAAGPKLIFADSATVGMNVSGQLSVDVREFELLARKIERSGQALSRRVSFRIAGLLRAVFRMGVHRAATTRLGNV